MATGWMIGSGRAVTASRAEFCAQAASVARSGRSVMERSIARYQPIANIDEGLCRASAGAAYGT